jgi:putative transposase
VTSKRIGPTKKWQGDISYNWIREGWLYLAVIPDLHSRRVVGWAVSNRMNRDLAIRGLNMAIALRSPIRGCIFHNDRGSQCCSHDYQRVLREHGLKPSMSGKGNCQDNAVVETFFKTKQGRTDLAKRMVGPTPGRSRHLPMHQRLS